MKSIVSIVAMTLMSFVAMAQGPQGARPERPERGTPPTDEERIERKVGFMKESLGLTDKQAEELISIFTEREEAVDAAREAYRKEMDEIRSKCQSSVEKILSSEQLENWRKMIKERWDRRPHHEGPGYRHDGPGHHRHHHDGPWQDGPRQWQDDSRDNGGCCWR